jgi:hypothetical protein
MNALNTSASHESGHALLRWLLNYEIKCAQIGETDADCFVDSEHLTSWFAIKQLADLRYSFNDLLCACAGFAAAESVTGVCDENEWSLSKDRHKGFEVAKRLSRNDEEAAELLMSWARRMAFLIVSKHQPMVQRLADALLTHRKLTGEEISDLLGGTTTDGVSLCVQMKS